MWDVMIGKGFKATKCKTLLRLAMARIKLLRNKRDIQVKQLRKDIAQLLTTGQEPSARIRVEHIIREQNILAAYDILELFCELVAVRLPIIESQKNCPLDLKEAISSLIFASPRCSDLPELLQIQALFAAKYGKEFAAAAAELRPDCAVNRRIIEKLSVRAPPGDVKLKLMKEIAAEHNVDWDATDAEAELTKVHEDLLDGPKHFIGAHEMPLSPSSNSGLPSLPSDLHTIDMAPLNSHINFDFASPELGTSSPASVNVEKGKQFVPFKNNPPPVNYEASSPTVHLSGQVQKDERHNYQEGSTTSNTIPDAKEGVHVPTRNGETMYYSDVGAAAKAAAESADRAVAAAQAAAELARKYKDRGALEPNLRKQDSSITARDESSDTDLDSDSEDGGNLPVKHEDSHGKRGGGKYTAPAFDSDSDVEEYDVPRGRGAGGTKAKLKETLYKQIDTQRAYEEPKVPSKATRLDFESTHVPDKPAFDEYGNDYKGVKDYKYSRGVKQGRENRSYGGSSTPGKKGGGLRWHSKQEPGRQNSDKEMSATPFSAIGSIDYSRETSQQQDENFGSGKSFSFDQPYASESARAKVAPKSREGSPLFDEEGSVGKSQKSSRLGSIPRTSDYSDQHDISPLPSPSKPDLDSFRSPGKMAYGSWARRGGPNLDSFKTFGSENSPRQADYDDVTARFEALKAKR